METDGARWPRATASSLVYNLFRPMRFKPNIRIFPESAALNKIKHFWMAALTVLQSLVASLAVTADEPSSLIIESSLVHVRSADQREWDWFPEQPDANVFERRFKSAGNSDPWTLTVRQQDVKQTWQVRLNDKLLGTLVRDENDLEQDYLVPAGAAIEGENRLEIRCTGGDSDDVRLGHVRLYTMSPDQLRGLTDVEISLVDADGKPIPGRITITNSDGTLMPIGAVSSNTTAVRQGVVYTLTGQVKFGVAPGRLRIVASRGFEYSTNEAIVDAIVGLDVRQTLTLRRQVDTDGWVACDTHVHTVTHSGHGDCTIEERMVTLAGEGIELPIATDHNKAIDYRPVSNSVGSTPFFTPVIGDECTTKKGHFNIFPIRPGIKLPDHTQEDWAALLNEIRSTPDVRVAILNHARDIHSGFRPFSPAHHVGLTGERLDERPLDFNAMEILNSGAVQTDLLQLFFDWCGLINRGLAVTPVGCSDSHDVARYIVGQGRTYIRCDDSDPGQIDIDQAIDAFVAGRVIVSYGLFVRLTVDGTAGPGDLVPLRADQDELVVTAEVLAPAWTQADSIALYVCGREQSRQQLNPAVSSGDSRHQTHTWRIPRSELKHDLWLTVAATGPGISDPVWKTASPYQPTSISFESSVFSSTGPVRIDVDGDGAFTSPLKYAKTLVLDYAADQSGLIQRLDECHPSVIHQVASLLRQSGTDPALLESQATEDVASAIAEYRRAYRQCVVAKLEGIE